MKLLYSSDFHGNPLQYKKFFKHAIDCCVDAVILGGDLAPKNIPLDDFFNVQKLFFEKAFKEMCESYLNQNSKSKIFVIMGNDDVKANEKFFLENDGRLFNYINEKAVPLGDGFSICGYSYIPITPFRLKEWDKNDCYPVPCRWRDFYVERMQDAVFDGIRVSESGILENYTIDEETFKKNTIEFDLEKLAKLSEPSNTIYVIHASPAKTPLDITSRGHVGSVAVNWFVEKNQPLLTLHGHIHETVDLSGKYVWRCKNSFSATAGNNNLDNKLSILEIEITDHLRILRGKI